MTTLQRHKQGNFEFSFRGYHVSEFPQKSLVGRSIEKAFLGDLLKVGSVLVPIVTTLYKDEHYLIDGIKRVLHCQYICGLENSDVAKYKLTYNHREAFQVVWAKMFYDIDPNDQAAWSIIMNMARDDNPLHTWHQMSQLQRAGKFDEAVQLYHLNKQALKKVAVLGELINPDFWFQQYSVQLISEANLFSLARMNAVYQRAAEAWATENPKKKFTANNLKELKSARNAQTLLSMPALPTFNVSAVCDGLYMILDADENPVEGPFHGKKDPGDNILYRLIKV